MTLSELKTARAAAGSRYAAAVEELRQSYIELAAHDRVLTNGNVGFPGAPDLRTFHPHPQNQGDFQHPEFAPIDPTKCWRDEISARRDELLKSILN